MIAITYWTLRLKQAEATAVWGLIAIWLCCCRRRWSGTSAASLVPSSWPGWPDHSGYADVATDARPPPHAQCGLPARTCLIDPQLLQFSSRLLQIIPRIPLQFLPRSTKIGAEDQQQSRARYGVTTRYAWPRSVAYGDAAAGQRGPGSGAMEMTSPCSDRMLSSAGAVMALCDTAP